MNDRDSEDLAEDAGETIATVPVNLTGERLDKALALLLPALSRSRIKALILDGQVSADGETASDPSQKVRAGQEIVLVLPPPEDTHIPAEDIPLDIVYEDGHLLVINKPVGMVVHPGAGNAHGTLVGALLHHCGDSLSGIGGVARPGIVHRLDKDTSGLMVAAKTDAAHRHLSAQLSDRSLSRVYLALVLGVPMPRKGSIDRPIGRHPSHRLKMAVAGKDGRDALTHYRVAEDLRGLFSLVECRLSTGRTHQIRVHMASLRHPLIGDQLYGPQATALRSALKKGGYDEDAATGVLSFPRQALHAAEIAFLHPETGEEMHFSVPLPPDMRDLLTNLK